VITYFETQILTEEIVYAFKTISWRFFQKRYFHERKRKIEYLNL